MRSGGLRFVSAFAPVLLCVGVLAQAPPAFDAASVKRNSEGGPRSGVGIQPGGHVTITNQTLRQIIRNAFGSSDIEVVGGPDWIGTDRWDIVATAGTGDADPPWRAMLKSLLMERFRLDAHVESRERPIYALTVARSDRTLGPNIRPSKSDTFCTDAGSCGTARLSGNAEAGTINSTDRAMAGLAQSLTQFAERRVIDRTGLDGHYDFELKWSDTSVFTALQEQLGLKLQPATGPVDVVVVDRVERPTEN
jgi:uncharacterized protein (TIGR03435 family)